jgi:hypothetical protein
MASFELNKAEENTLKILKDSIKVLYGDESIGDVKYLITNSGIGLKVEVVITSKKRLFRLFTPIKKDITDYDCW